MDVDDGEPSVAQRDMPGHPQPFVVGPAVTERRRHPTNEGRIGRLLIEEKDEYLRSLLVRQMLVATGLTMVVATIYGFLENYGLVGHVDAFYLTILFFFGLGVGSLVNRLTLGDASC